METIAIFALIVSVIALIKILVILVKPKAWYNLTKGVWSAPKTMMMVCLILAAIVFYYLIQSMTIIQIMAAALFIVLLSGMSMSVYSREMVSLAQKVLNDRKIVARGWLPILIWLALILWALKEILI